MAERSKIRKESMLFLFAGILSGLVAGFILTREHYLKKSAESPRPRTQAQSSAAQPSGMPAQPEQHDQMILQFMEKAKEPGNYPDKVQLGNIYYDLGNWEQAVFWYEAAIGISDQDPNVLVDLGVCYRSLNQYDRALAMFDRALEIEDNKKEALYNSAIVSFFDLGNVGKATEILDRMEKAYPNDPAIARLRGEIQKTSGP